MRILLTNDDGINAPGLHALRRSVEAWLPDDAEIVVVAPDRGRSECGHSVTSGRPLKIREVEPCWFAVDGTPVDCVRVALKSVCPDADAVISGVNAGANLGVDLLVSGTFAAAREAAIERVPAMAVSHYRRPGIPVSWQHVPRWLTPTLDEFAERTMRGRGKRSQRSPVLWNVNLPAIDPEHSEIPPRVWCQVDTRPLERAAKREQSQVTFESDFHGRPRDPDRDVACCFSGSITISEVKPHLD